MKSILVSFALLSAIILPSGCAMSNDQTNNQSSSLSGQVSRVWEDGFQLDTDDRSITVDAYDICGDNTARYIAVGDQVTITGEFEGREFDAFSIAKGDQTNICG